MNHRLGPSGTLREKGSINTLAFTSSYLIKVEVKLWEMLKVENLV